MSQEPTFPADAMPGRADAAKASPAPAGPAEAAAQPEEPATPVGEALAGVNAAKSRLWPAAGVAIGIGSAAIAAALIYRSRRE